jgi:serine protease AprX
VIVQQMAGATGAETQVAKMGGTVTRDLSIIHAFAAEMPAEAAVELARSESVRWVSLDAPVQQAISKNITWATKLGTVVTNGFTDPGNMLSPVGMNGTYAYGAKVKGAFGGFLPAYVPGEGITKVVVMLREYPTVKLGSTETPKLTAHVAGQAGSTVTIPVSVLTQCGTTNKPCTVSVDITNTRTWKWSDFSTLEIVIDQSAVASNHPIYYDAVGLAINTGPGVDSTVPLVMSSEADTAAINTSVLTNVFQKATRAESIWNESPYWQGSGMTVAVIDSGSFRNNAIGGRLIGEINFNSAEHTNNDQYGHGSFVTGLIADDGELSAGKYMGIAPRVNILGVRVSDDYGMSLESDVISAMQWVLNNKATYNIRVVNLSLNSSVAQSYHTSPLDAAAEILWFNGIVVVASAGNNGSATLYAPANDPFVITVGATNDLNTASLTDDIVASFSAYGTDESGRAKPDLVAPGTNLIAYLPDAGSLTISVEHPTNRIDANYFRMSGTSMSAPLVSGAVAILLQSNPNLTPDQVKYRLKATANKTWPGYNATTAGAGYLDVYAAVKGTTTQSANTNNLPSQLLSTGTDPITFGSVGWNSVGWNSVGWNSVGWNSVGWNSVGWNSDYWGN